MPPPSHHHPVRLAAPAPVKREQDSQAHAPPRVELAVASKGSGLFLPFQEHGNVRGESWGGRRGARGPPHWNVSALSPPVRRATTRPLPNQERCGWWWEGAPGREMGQQAPTWHEQVPRPRQPQPGTRSSALRGRPGLTGISGAAARQDGGQGLVPITAHSRLLVNPPSSTAAPRQLN